MKAFTKLFLGAITTLIACSCNGGGSETNMDLAVGSESIGIRNDRVLLGLLGPVKRIEVESEMYTIDFDKYGKRIVVEAPTTRYNGRVRKDQYPDETVTTYTFDELGRLLSEKGEFRDYTYEYEGNYYFPVSMKGKEMDEYEGSFDVSHTYSYKASDFDDYGNWILRKDNGIEVKRVIVYYDDPYYIKRQKLYDTPEDVALAMLKALQKEDVNGYLQTLEYDFRESYKITPQYIAEMFEKDRKNGDGVKSYKIENVNEKADDYAEVTAIVTTTNDKHYQYTYAFSRGKIEKSHWFNIMGEKRKEL